MNLIVYAVATKYGVPIINYSGAFSNAQVGYGGTAYASGGTALGFGPSVGQFPGSGSFFTPSTGRAFTQPIFQHLPGTRS